VGFITEKAKLKATYEETISTPTPTPNKEIGPTFPKIDNSLYVRTKVDSEKTPSPIEILHTKQSSLSGKFPLAEYYAQSKGTGRLAARGSQNLLFNEPFVLRDIGDRWGKADSFNLGDSTFSNTVETIIKIGGSLIDSIGGAVLGRTPSEYIGNSLGNLERTGKFLATQEGIGFLTKQSELMSRNAQKSRTDARYGLINDVKKQSENPRKYFIPSLGSLPGVTLININTPDPNLIITGYMDSIASVVSSFAINLSSPVLQKVVDLGGAALNFVGGLIGGALSKLGGSKLEIKGLKLPTISLNTPTLNLENVKEKARQIGEAAQQFAKIDVKANISKKTQVSILDAKILGDVGVDKVNMIPYGKRNADEQVADDNLDFIPFRFEDMNGNRIVFRALLSGITDTFTPEYAAERYIGRPDNVYVYLGTTREVSFTFDIYPKSDQELVRLWEKMNYLAGLTYPSWAGAAGGGAGMVAPFCKLTIGDMFKDTSGYISSLTYTVQDNGTWETVWAKLPKYIQASCTFVYIGDRLPSSSQKHYEVPWIAEEKYSSTNSNALTSLLGNKALDLLGGDLENQSKQAKSFIKKLF
jgi:hypothetical protein